MKQAMFEGRNEKRIRYILASLLMVLAINALGGGIYGMTGAKNVPKEWLNESFFDSYLIPGIFLFTCIGIPALLASIAVFRQKPHARKASFICAVLTILWIMVQVAIIGYVSWLQPVVFTAAVVIFILTAILPNHDN